MNDLNNRTDFLHILDNDIRVGCKKNVLLYLFALIFSVFTAFSYYKLTHRYYLRGDISAMPGALDYLVNMLGGLKLEDVTDTTEIPVIWMSIQILVCSSVYIYPVNDLYGRGSIILLQYGSKFKWWISKCIWSIIQILIIYLILFCSTTVCALLYGGDLQYHTQIAETINKITISDTNLLNILIFVTPITYSIMAAVVQINLSLVIGPVNSFICLVVYHVLSVYCSSELLLGNYSMIYRIKCLTGRGIDWFPELIICSCIFAIAICLGIRFFRSYDIIGKKG